MRDTLTVNSLLSGYTPDDKRSKRNKKDYSLMPHLDGKLFIIKDFTLMLKMRHDTFHEILGQLRAAYDGYLDRQVGQGHKSAVAKFGLIACVTSEIDQHRHLLTSLGERCLSYRMPTVSQHEARKRSMKATDGHLSSDQKYQLAAAAQELMLTNPTIPTITADQRRQIVNIAAIIAKARTEVRRNPKTKEPDIPEVEVPTRLSKQLVDLCLGITMSRNKRKVSKDEITLIQKTALHSITPKRYRLFKELLKHYPDDISCTDLSESLKFSTSAVDIWLHDLWLLNLVKRREIVKFIGETKRATTCHLWQLSDARMLKKIVEIDNF
jgi:predicted transcriptional regulator